MFRLSQFLFLSETLMERKCAYKNGSAHKENTAQWNWLTWQNVTWAHSVHFRKNKSASHCNTRDAYFIYSVFQYLSGHRVGLSFFLVLSKKTWWDYDYFCNKRILFRFSHSLLTFQNPFIVFIGFFPTSKMRWKWTVSFDFQPTTIIILNLESYSLHGECAGIFSWLNNGAKTIQMRLSLPFDHWIISWFTVLARFFLFCVRFIILFDLSPHSIQTKWYKLSKFAADIFSIFNILA